MKVFLALLACAGSASAQPLGVSPAQSWAQNEAASVQLSLAAGGEGSPAPRKQPGWARFASGMGTKLFVVGGTLLPLLRDGKDGGRRSLRVADSLLTATLLTEGLKRVVREKRPDSDSRTSFPSGHATAAFAVASMQGHYHPRQAIFWYAGATTIAASRVALNRHYTHDVVAGALIGAGVSQVEIKQQRGLILFPFIRGEKQERTTGLGLSGTF